MSKVYSTYEAKSRFSEILRLVRAGQTVLISYHGREVAEIKPVSFPQTFQESLRRLEEEGVVLRGESSGAFQVLAKKPGALARFLESRD